MSLFHRSIKWVMLIAGLLTCTMFHAAIDPVAAMQSNYGESLEGPLAQVIVRSWGVLIGLMGLLLIYGAFNVAARRIALVMAGTSKIAYIILLLVYGQQLPGSGVRISLIADSIMVLLFVMYLAAMRSDRSSV